jgi:DNA-directed RNA polymerase specialized sigma24 family protein
MIATDRAGAIAAFYAEHHRRVARGVAAHAGAVDDAVLDDACAFAWSVLVRRDDVNFDRRGVKWLIVVGARKAWELARLARRETPVGGFLSAVEPNEMVEPAGLASEPVDRLIALEEHADRLARFQRPKPRERREMFLHAAGFRYAEIAELTGSTYTAVNRRISEGRRRLYEPDEAGSGGEHRSPST